LKLHHKHEEFVEVDVHRLQTVHRLTQCGERPVICRGTMIGMWTMKLETRRITVGKMTRTWTDRITT
jgi:hypothetical protein